ncbi:MAG: hypothetical protein ABI581_08720 [Sediminibacterium sp.]
MITKLTDPIINLLTQVQALLDQLSDQQFIVSMDVLSGASLGQHTRHILEFYLELIRQYDEGKINYDARERNHTIESDRSIAINCLQFIIDHIERDDKQLLIMGDYGIKDQQVFTIPTNYYRELMYNLEHTVHHMAFMRIGVNAVSPIVLAEDFGVAVSTVKYRNACAR